MMKSASSALSDDETFELPLHIPSPPRRSSHTDDEDSAAEAVQEPAARHASDGEVDEQEDWPMAALQNDGGLSPRVVVAAILFVCSLLAAAASQAWGGEASEPPLSASPSTSIATVPSSEAASAPMLSPAPQSAECSSYLRLHPGMYGCALLGIGQPDRCASLAGGASSYPLSAEQCATLCDAHAATCRGFSLVAVGAASHGACWLYSRLGSEGDVRLESKTSVCIKA